MLRPQPLRAGYGQKPLIGFGPLLICFTLTLVSSVPNRPRRNVELRFDTPEKLIETLNELTPFHFQRTIHDEFQLVKNDESSPLSQNKGRFMKKPISIELPSTDETTTAPTTNSTTQVPTNETDFVATLLGDMFTDAPPDIAGSKANETSKTELASPKKLDSEKVTLTGSLQTGRSFAVSKYNKYRPRKYRKKKLRNKNVDYLDTNSKTIPLISAEYFYEMGSEEGESSEISEEEEPYHAPLVSSEESSLDPSDQIGIPEGDGGEYNKNQKRSRSNLRNSRIKGRQMVRN